MVPDHRLPRRPIHHHGPRKQTSILRHFSQSITLAGRAFHQLPSLPTAHVFKDTLQLVRRGSRLGDFELKGVARHRGVLGSVVRRLIFRRGLARLGRGLFEDRRRADGGLDGGFVEEGDDIEGFGLEKR